MTCDYCLRQMNYCVYINDAHWIKVVGEEKFDKNVGHVCAHCALERLGGLSWYIIWNEPTEKIRTNIEVDARAACPQCARPEERTIPLEDVRRKLREQTQ